MILTIWRAGLPLPGIHRRKSRDDAKPGLGCTSRRRGRCLLGCLGDRRKRFGGRLGRWRFWRYFSDASGDASSGAATARPEEEPALPDSTGLQAEAEPDDLRPIVINPLMSAGIFVDGLEYDIEMPWGHEEFEELREFYLSAGGKKWLKAVMQRSLPYLAFVEEKIYELNLPRELLYLPIIESEYSPYAVSRSGATGIWQFMHNSITGYGLAINEWKDDRRDFMRSTTGALSKLRDNYEAFGRLVLAVAPTTPG